MKPRSVQLINYTTMKATDFKYLHYMTLKEWKQFVKNYHHYMTIKNHIIYCEENQLDFHWFVSNAFYWDGSLQNHAYWSEIAYRTKPVK